MGRQGMAGLIRPQKPKILQGTYATDSDSNLHDGTDCTNEAKIFRGTNTSYAIPGDAVNSDLRLAGEPLAKLLGDEFCSSAESSLYLLADNTSAVSQGTLTENPAAFTYAKETVDDESPLYEQLVPTLNGTTQYYSRITEAQFQVGTNGFMSGQGFKTSTVGVLQVVYSYGSHVAAKAYWECRINSSNKLEFEIWDGTTTNTITDPIANRWQDGKWHIPVALVDKTNSIIIFECDGVFIGSIAITATLTLTVTGESFYIGARKSTAGAIEGFFNGSVGIFKLVNNGVDYNIPQVWNLGIREPVSSGVFTTPINDSNKRLNNKFGTPNTNGSYFYSILNLEEGEYEIQIEYEAGASNGKLDLIIDGVTVRSGLDTYSASTLHNQIDKTFRVKITDGYHTIKILNNGKNASSTGYVVNLQWINFIKRRGHENGGASEFLLFGDEINERSSATFTLQTTTTLYYNNDFVTIGNGNYTEGSLFIKGGLYRIDIFYIQNTDRAIADLWFGNVQVLNLFDMNGSLNLNAVKTIYVRLQQGRQDIRLAVNGKTGTSYQIDVNEIRGVRLSD